MKLTEVNMKVLIDGRNRGAEIVVVLVQQLMAFLVQ